MTAAKAIHTQFVKIAQELSPPMADAIAHTAPIDLSPDQDSPFAERLCRAVAGQQLSIKAAAAIWGRVVEQAGQRSLTKHFAIANPDDLRTCGLSAAKAKAMRAIAIAEQAGHLDTDILGAINHEARSKQLIEIWGVGQWTADMMSIFYFGDADVWPDGDTTARKMLERLTSPRRKTIRTAARFAPYRSYLALYMWHQVDATPD
ncbi:MAG: DNA-3-methyladenine glycosylase 2 family protein [Cyanobacteria bacterium J06626_18]